MDYSEFKRAFKSENFVENLEEFCDVKYLQNLGNFNDFFTNAVYFDLCQNSKDLLKVLLISKDENEFIKFCKILGIRSEFGLKILKNEKISFENKIQIKILYIYKTALFPQNYKKEREFYENLIKNFDLSV